MQTPAGRGFLPWESLCHRVTGGEKPHPTKCSKGAGKSFCALAIVLPMGHVRSLREGNAHMKAGLAGGARRVELYAFCLVTLAQNIKEHQSHL